MGDPTPSSLVSERPPEALVYRPLSGLALAGFVLSSAFALLVVTSTLIALIKGVPFFLSGWMALLPAFGTALSYLGLRHIRFSEGTRAGISLARWGLWIGVFTGLGYYAYSVFTGLALTQQADAFLSEKDEDSGFFPRLAEGKSGVNYAFLLTLPPSARSGSNPDNDGAMRRQYDQPSPDGKPGMLSRFANHPLTQAIRAAGPGNYEVEPLGVQEWKYENNGYLVRRNYRIRTPEAVFLILVPVQSIEGSGEGERRRWFVKQNEMRLEDIKPTPLGAKVDELRSGARSAARQWLNLLNSGKPWKEFTAKDRTDWAALQRESGFPQDLRKVVTALFEDNRGHMFIELPTEEAPLGWERTQEGRMAFAQPFTLKVPDESRTKAMVYSGEIVIESQQPIDPRNPPEASPQWRIGRIILRGAKTMGAPGP